MRPSILAILSLIVTGFGEPAGGQNLEPGPRTVFRVQSNLVRVPVSVTDASGNAVLDLGPDDFRIEENGRQEALARIADPGRTSLELALLIDISGSIKSRFDFEQQAAARFLRMVLRPEDSMLIFSIGTQPNLIQPRTADLGEALRSLCAAMPTTGATAFYDTVVMAAHALRANPLADSRRVIVALSDGEDNYSTSHGLANSIHEVQGSDCIFYSINPGGPSIHLNRMSLEGQNALLALANQTGGTAFVPSREEELDTAYGVIAAELRAQYLLEYYSSDQNGDGTFRHIIVRSPTHPNLRIRSRQGYFSART